MVLRQGGGRAAAWKSKLVLQRRCTWGAGGSGWLAGWLALLFVCLSAPRCGTVWPRHFAQAGDSRTLPHRYHFP